MVAKAVPTMVDKLAPKNGLLSRKRWYMTVPDAQQMMYRVGPWSRRGHLRNKK